jgi:hypothetical protein
MTAAKFAVLHIFNVRITLEIATPQNVENSIYCTIVHKKIWINFLRLLLCQDVNVPVKTSFLSSANIFEGNVFFIDGFSPHYI